MITDAQIVALIAAQNSPYGLNYETSIELAVKLGWDILQEARRQEDERDKLAHLKRQEINKVWAEGGGK